MDAKEVYPRLACPILCLADTMERCKDYARYFMIEKNGVFEIAPMTAQSIGTVFIGILADLPGWKDSAIDIYAQFTQDRQRFVLDNEKQLADVNRARAMHPAGEIRFQLHSNTQQHGLFCRWR